MGETILLLAQNGRDEEVYDLYTVNERGHRNVWASVFSDAFSHLAIQSEMNSTERRGEPVEIVIVSRENYDVLLECQRELGELKEQLEMA